MPRVVRFPVTCWTAEPSVPTKPVGGVQGTQNVAAFAPIDGKSIARADMTFKQPTTQSFARGGAKPKMAVEDIPNGVFLSFRGHPVYSITSIEFPAERMDPISRKKVGGIRIAAEFMHLPSMGGECHFYAAVWLASRQ